MICQSCNKEKKMYAKELCRSCYVKKRFVDNPESYEKHKEWSYKSLEKVKKTAVCNILKKHAEDLKNDPERLSTKFLQSMIGIKCKNKK